MLLLSNHQTEADPAVIATMLEHTHPQLATDIVRKDTMEFSQTLREISTK